MVRNMITIMTETDLPDLPGLPKDQTVQYWSSQTMLGIVERHTAECIMKVARDRGDRVYDNGHYFVVEE
jgi:hypothetical protein